MDKRCKDSIILIDKPAGITSFEVVKSLRKTLGIKKIGHAGVLDKPATGLLVLATGRATKLIPIFEDGYKIYVVEIIFGIKTDTYDSTGRVIAQKRDFSLTKEELEGVLERFTGRITQQVPPYSNVKVNGKRLYSYAVRNQQVELPRREVTIHGIRLDSFEQNRATITVKCSKGTYIRSLVNDIGEALNTYACVGRLRRIFSFPFSIEDASTLENPGCIEINEAISHLPSLRVEAYHLKSIENGVPFDRLFDCRVLNDGIYRVLVGNRLVAVVEKKGRAVKYRLILPYE